MNNTRVHQVISAMVFTACTASVALADTLEVPIPYGTIQAAIDAAVDGDTVLVADGTYSGPGNRDLDFGGRSITVQSENGPADCTIDIDADDADPHRAFHFHTKETVSSVVEGFTIQNGFMNRGGAVLCEAGSSPLFQSCVFQQNSVSQAAAEDGGGAVYTLGSSPTFIDCEFVQNHAEANFSFGGGGAVQNQSGGIPTFIGCAFSENTAFGSQVSDSGAVLVGQGCHPEFYSCTFTANQADWDGAVDVLGSATMHDCHFQGNMAINRAAGAYGMYGTEAGGGGSSELVNCSFVGNSAATGHAGGAVVVQLSDTSATFTNCLFADNHATGRGGGMWVRDDTNVVVTNCTFSGNTSGNVGGGLSVRNGANVAVDNSVLWNNAPDEVHLSNAVLSISYSDIQGGWAGDGNIDENPLFRDDYHLSPGSPCIDAADSTAVPEGTTTDLDGNPRFVNDLDTQDTGVSEGGCPVVDMGASEFQDGTIECCPADFDGDGVVEAFDLALLLGAWGPCPEPCEEGNPEDTCAADLSGDCEVEAFDLALLLGAWGPCT